MVCLSPFVANRFVLAPRGQDSTSAHTAACYSRGSSPKPTNTAASSTVLRSDTTALAGKLSSGQLKRDAFHDHLVVGDAGVLAHHR